MSPCPGPSFGAAWQLLGCCGLATDEVWIGWVGPQRDEMGQLPLAPKGPTCFLHADPFCITAPQGTKRAAGCIKPTDGTKRRGHINNNGQQTKSWASVRIKPTWASFTPVQCVWDGVNPFRRAPRRICSQPTLVPKVCVKCPEFCCIMHRMTLPRRCLSSRVRLYCSLQVSDCTTQTVSLVHCLELFDVPRFHHSTLTLMSKYSLVVVSTYSSGSFLLIFVDSIKISKGPAGFKSLELLTKVSAATDKNRCIEMSSLCRFLVSLVGVPDASFASTLQRKAQKQFWGKHTGQVAAEHLWRNKDGLVICSSLWFFHKLYFNLLLCIIIFYRDR